MPKISLSASDYDALIAACKFLTECRNYSFESTNIDEESAHIAIEKLVDETDSYTRSEKRAILAGIVLALRALNGETHLFDSVRYDLVKELHSLKPNLEQLFPVYLKMVNCSGR